MRKLAALICILTVTAVSVFPQAPERLEQFVYSVLAFNGKDYTGTFSRQGSESIYLLADVDNFLTARKTFVYFWPLTQEWKTEGSILDVELDGSIQITGPGRPSGDLGKKRYTYYNIKSEYEYNWEVATGEDADEIYAQYLVLRDAYWDARSQWSQDNIDYQREMNDLADRIMDVRRAGRDPAELVERLKTLDAQGPPPEPEDQDVFAVPPREVRESYNINLPAGQYRIKFLNPDGTIMEGSERRLVIFQKRRANGTGYDVIPADKWTRPVESNGQGSVLYVNGQVEVFLRPFHQDEFNDLQHAKLIRNDARGNASLYRWVKIQQVPGAKIELRGTAATTVIEEPYTVEQIPGAALGYRIKEYIDQDREPDLWAYRIPVTRQEPVLRVTSFDSQGSELPGSLRQIRVVWAARARGPLFILALLPLAVMALVMAFRATKVG